MKQKLSISMDSEKVKVIEKIISNDSRFRNKSHVIEHAVDLLLKNIKEE
jgi:Arc/MetJ-type ribon-helix-helix transcriptional regulator